MPNTENVHAPVSLIGPGRSGTTLVTNIFRRHPDFDALGETTNFIFTTYRNLEESLPYCGRMRGEATIPEASRAAVHSMLTGTFPSEKPRWFHKPIFLPRDHTRWNRDEFDAWYWATSAFLFPDARIFTVVRDPAETAASIMARWGNTEAVAFQRLARNYQLMLHPDNRLGLVIDFEFLTSEPESAVKLLMDFSGAPYHEDCLHAFETEHAVNPSAERASGLDVPPRITGLYRRLQKQAKTKLEAQPSAPAKAKRATKPRAKKSAKPRSKKSAS